MSHRKPPPYLFAYDVSDPRRARRVRRCLQHWRLDGQYSVHETQLTPARIRDLTVELLETLNPDQDKLLVCRLSRGAAAGPVSRLSVGTRPPPLAGRPLPVIGQRPLTAGWYLLAYDIRDPRRLRRVQRRAARQCLALQRSVYLYHGPGQPLEHLLADLRNLVDPAQDDLRLYPFADPSRLWFPCGALPPLPGLEAPGVPGGLWQRLTGWLRR